MTDREALFTYRLRQAEETLAETVRMQEEDFSARSVVNRAYYAMFYAVLALFIRFDIEHKTSKHSGVISIFDQQFVLAGKMERRFSRMLHRLFVARQKADYKELVELSREQAGEAVAQAKEFVEAVRELLSKGI
ncbi:MAG: HEPN domain-containing protein [Geobacter sp.]|nr:HEPN domain-containing protein [Geobacter sp.]